MAKHFAGHEVFERAAEVCRNSHGIKLRVVQLPSTEAQTDLFRLQLQQISLDLRAAFRHETEIMHANKTNTARITSTSFRANAFSGPCLPLTNAMRTSN